MQEAQMLKIGLSRPIKFILFVMIYRYDHIQAATFPESFLKISKKEKKFKFLDLKKKCSVYQLCFFKKLFQLIFLTF